MDIIPVSRLTGADVHSRYKEIQEVYLSDERPWVVGYSGGKDSTTALQMIWIALSQLDAAKLKKPVYIIASDTLVETPKIVEYIDESLDRMNEAARRFGLPFSAHKVQPEVNDTFWVNLIGRGYPAPSKRFRWCTDRMKIAPANKFIIDQVTRYGEVVVVLGVRKAESATRAQVMSLHRIRGTQLARHSSLQHAFVYAPIEDLEVGDVWNYLLQVPSPWGNNNRDLVTLYRNAQAGECPLVVDKSTPSCGNSRFGCWVCTVVTRDRSMEALVDSGEDWLQPLLDFREELAKTQDPAVKGDVREHKRRNGQVMLKADGSVVFGPYTFDVRKRLFRLLLEAQQKVRREGPDPDQQLITEKEVHAIRTIWRSEEQDWEDSAPQIFREVMGYDLDWVWDEQPGFRGEDKTLLGEICVKHGVSTEMVAKLLGVERELDGMSRRSGVHQKIASVFDEDWRPRSEVLSQMKGCDEAAQPQN
jgi:DNA sulfur modification protein DndC